MEMGLGFTAGLGCSCFLSAIKRQGGSKTLWGEVRYRGDLKWMVGFHRLSFVQVMVLAERNTEL